jgi:hypothetical protein
MNDRQRAQEERVNQPKSGHGCADTERERDNGGGGDSLVFEKLPPTEDCIGSHGFEPWR